MRDIIPFLENVNLETDASRFFSVNFRLVKRQRLTVEKKC